jgi:hypothetical protein
VIHLNITRPTASETWRGWHILPITGGANNNQVDPAQGLIDYEAGTTNTPPTGTFRAASVRFKVIGAAATTTVSYVAPSDVLFGEQSVVGQLGSATITGSARIFLPLVIR